MNNPKEKSGIKVIFFDMNGTLAHKYRSSKTAFHAVLQDFTGRWSVDQPSWNSDGIYEKFAKEWTRRTTQPVHLIKADHTAAYQALRKVLEPLPLEVNPAFAAKFFTRMKQLMIEREDLFPEVMDTLSTLSDRYRLALISNSSKSRIEQQIARFKLRPIFSEQQIFCSALTGFRKPHTAMFAHALDAMKVHAARSVMVGDSWKEDIQGAIHSGMSAVWVRRKGIKKTLPVGKDYASVIQIASLRELLTLYN